MIREVGRIARSRLLAVAHAADREGRGVALLDGDGWGGTELAFDPVEEQRIPFGRDALSQVTALLDRLSTKTFAVGHGGLPPASRWIGYVAYEAARSLEREAWTPEDSRPEPAGAALVLRRFSAVARRDATSGIVAVEGDDPRAVDRLAFALASASDAETPRAPLDLRPVDDDDVHSSRVVRALELIARGDLYVVNLARTFEGPSRARATELLATLLARSTARFGAAIDLGDHAVASSSPELLFDFRDDRVLTTPIKGTRPRGGDAASDAVLRDELARDPKEHAELTMIVDLERNDLGRIAEVGSVRVPAAPRIETSRTVHHRMVDVTARVRCGLGSVVAAAFPSGSVTGAPKVRAMEVIAELERDRRGVYCGALLSVRRDGSARAAMAIRTIVQSAGRAVYHAGGGIVADSDPRREVEETHWKARQVQARASSGVRPSGSHRDKPVMGNRHENV